MLDPAATTANLQFEGGAMTVAGWGDFGMSFASFQIEPAGVRLTTARLAPGGGSKGEIEIFNPKQVPLALAGGESEMAVRLDRIPLSTLLGPAFGKSISATVETREGAEDGILRLKGGDVPSISCHIPFHATATSDSSASLLPLFGILAEEVAESWYQAPKFDAGFSGTLVRDPAASGVEDLKMEARGRLMITGQLKADPGGALHGVLEIGLPAAALTDASVPFRLVFRRKEGGHAWATVKISGTGGKPLDDLEQQLDEAKASAAPASGGKDVLEEEFFNLTPEKR
jgi:hypothetical protein